MTPRLLYLNISGNKDPATGKELTEYRSYVIYLTRNLKGTNRCTGLIGIYFLLSDVIRIGWKSYFKR